MGKRKGKKKVANEEDRDVKANDIPAASRKIVQNLKEIAVNCSEEKIYATLVECNMNANLAIERLLSQERSEEVESNQGEQKETTDTSESCSQGVDSSIQNSELGNSGDHDVGQGGENKLNSIGKAVPTVRPPTRMISLDGPKMADVLKRSLGLSSKESVTEAPVKDDSPLHVEKPDATNPSSNSFTESDAARDQLGESTSVYDYKLPDDEEVTNAIKYAYINFAARSDQLQESASEPNLQMQNLYISPQVMHQQPYTREPDPQYSTLPFNQSMPTGQSIPTASALGRRPSISITESYNMPPSAAFEQHFGSNNSAYLDQYMDSVFPQYRNSNLPQSDTSIGPSAYDFGTWSGNAENARFRYEDVSSNHLPSFQRQGGNSNEWRQQGEDTYRVIPLHQRSQSFRHSQQEQQPSRGISYERRSAYYTSQNQQNNTRDPSDQTQRRLRGRDNH